ncbi:MAG: hypothetical protein K2J99_16970 [Lachnospiraceae bacterium]|nr:hypothetical protein [Lachnospiraceae bacterium]
MGASGGWNPIRDPMRNAGLSSQFIAYEQKRNNTSVSNKQRKLAYALMIVLGMFLFGIITLFFIL